MIVLKHKTLFVVIILVNMTSETDLVINFIF